MLSHSEVARRWVNTRGSGQAHGSRMFYNGPTIYSYGFHWPIAQWEENARGRQAVLMRPGGRSMSTRRHHGYVERALDLGGVTTFKVDRITGHPCIVSDVYYEQYVRWLQEAREGVYRPRIHKKTRDGFIELALYIVREMAAFSKFFELDWRIEPDDHFETILTRHVVESAGEAA